MEPEMSEQDPTNEGIKPDTQASSRDSWSLINSNIVIWFLGSVVLGSITGMYSCAEKRRDEAQKAHAEAMARVERQANEASAKAARRETLDFEIEGRLFQFLDEMEFLVEPLGRPTRRRDDLSIYWRKLLRRSPRNGGYNAMYSQYQDRSFVTLVTELATLVDDQKDAAALKHVVGSRSVSSRLAIFMKHGNDFSMMRCSGVGGETGLTLIVQQMLRFADGPRGAG
jgi:hypothetical protein